MISRLASCLAAALIAAAAVPPAAAQSLNYGKLQDLFGEPVTTSATGSPQRASDVPANMEIITQDDIRRSGAANIPDVLKYVVGLDVRQYSSGQEEVAVRGYDKPRSSRLLVLVNGRQVYLDYYGFTSWQDVPVRLEEIRQIEVIRGPNSALFGFNAAGGVINIITFNSVYDSTNAVSVQGGTQHDGSVSAVATLHAGDKTGLRLSAGGDQSSEFDRSTIPSRYVAGIHPRNYTFSGDGRTEVAPDVEARLEVSATSSQAFDLLPAITFANVDARTESARGTVLANTAFGLLDVGAYVNNLHFVTQTINNGVAGNETPFYNRILVAHANDTFKLAEDHTIRLAFEYRDSVNHSPLYGTDSTDFDYHVLSASAMWAWQISNDLSFTNAVRYDQLAFDVTSLLVGDPFTVADFDNHHVDQLSFNSGLVYAPTHIDTLRLLVARGTQLPSVYSYAFQQNSGTTMRWGDPFVKPTALYNYELDWDRRIPTYDLMVRTAVYYQMNNDEFIDHIQSPPPVEITHNIGTSLARGAEIALSGNWGPEWTWKVSYAYETIVDHTPFANAVNFASYQGSTPDNKIIAQFGYHAGAWEFDTNMKWQSNYLDYAPNASGVAQTYLVPNYFTMDLRAAYRVVDGVTLSLSVQQALYDRLVETSGVPVERRILGRLTIGF